MGDREVNFQELTESDLRGIVGNLYCFGMLRSPRANHVVNSIRLGAPGIPRPCAGHTAQPLKDRLHAPEAAARQHGLLLGFTSRSGNILRRIRKRSRALAYSNPLRLKPKYAQTPRQSQPPFAAGL